MTSPASRRSGPRLLIAAMASRSRVKTRAGPTFIYTPSGPTTLGSMAVLLITAPSGARLPLGNVTVLVSPRARARGIHDHVVGADAVHGGKPLPQRAPPVRRLPPVEDGAEPLAAHGQRVELEQPEATH